LNEESADTQTIASSGEKLLCFFYGGSGDDTGHFAKKVLQATLLLHPNLSLQHLMLLHFIRFELITRCKSGEGVILSP
jgi:hypothetical protein